VLCKVGLKKDPGREPPPDLIPRHPPSFGSQATKVYPVPSPP
jgi:hypothetical protein